MKQLQDTIFSRTFEFLYPIFALPVAMYLITGLFGGMGNNALTEPSRLSADLLAPIFQGMQHYVNING